MSNENEPTDEVEESAENTASEEAAAEESVAGDELDTLRAERAELYERFLRSQAEFENFKKRTQKERTDAAKYAAGPVVRDLLPVLDNLHRAAEAAAKDESAGGLVEGVGMVVQQLDGVLASHGVTPIETANATFDPNLHEALQQVPSPEHPPMTIVQEVERGYTLHDRVLRPAKVVVSSGPPTGNAVA